MNKEEDKQNVERLVFVITLLLVVIMAARMPVDSDLWWHLRAGEEMLRTGKPLLHDVFSYTRSGAEWINHSWLSEVILAQSDRWLGYLGPGLWVALLATLSMGLVYFQMEGRAFLRAFVIILASAVSGVVWSPRPQTASLALFALTGLLLYQYKWRGRDRLWMLVPAFILWSNLHGGYPLGLLLIGAYIAGEVLNHLRLRPVALPWKRILRLALWGAAAFLVVAINPNGAQMYLIPFKTVNVGVLQQFIQEWASPDFHDLVQQPFLWMLFATVIAMTLARRPVDGTDLAAFTLFGALALVARRNFGPFALAAAPVLSRSLSALMCEWWGSVRMPEKVAVFLKREGSAIRSDIRPGLAKAINLTVVALIAFVAVAKLAVVNHPALVESQIQAAFPAGAVEYLRRNQPEGEIFNAYNWGGYLLWALPGIQVFVDGRTDLYGDEILGEWIKIVQGEDGWQAALDRWQARLVLLEPDRPVVKLLPQNGWKLLSQEEGYVLYGR